MRRRSVSSLVSPGPRVPMPPPSRDSAAPAPTSRGSRYLQLRELDLQLAFPRARAPREDVENELGAIDDLPADLLFDVPQLRRRQLVVEDDDVDARSRRTTPRASATCPRRETSTDRASAAPAARAARPRRRRLPRGRPARRASARLRGGARGRRSGRRAPPVPSRLRAAECDASPCLNVVPRDRSGAHQPRAPRRSRRRSSTARRRGCGRASSSRSTRSPSVRSTSSGSAVAGWPLMLALVAVTDRPTARRRARARRRWSGTRTPTLPVPPRDVGARASTARP